MNLRHALFPSVSTDENNNKLGIILRYATPLFYAKSDVAVVLKKAKFDLDTPAYAEAG